MTPKEYFTSQDLVSKKRYDAMREFHLLDRPAAEVAQKYGYTINALYSLSRDFQIHLKKVKDGEDFFFKSQSTGRKPIKKEGLRELCISLRKKNYTVEEILGIANSKGYGTSYWSVYEIITKEGFARLPRRTRKEKTQLELPPIQAPMAEKLELKPEKFYSSKTGLLVFLSVIHTCTTYEVRVSMAYIR
jgi:hypothetical protein